MLRCIPRYPRKVTARELMERIQSEGYSITKRTVERDLQAMSAIFPLVADEREKPYGWSWSVDAPSFDLPGLSPSQALTFKSVSYTHLDVYKRQVVLIIVIGFIRLIYLNTILLVYKTKGFVYLNLFTLRNCQ